MNFNIDSDIVVDTVAQALEEVGAHTSEAQFMKIAQAIEDAMPGVIGAITQGVANFWKKEASDSGTGWGSKYASAITYKVDGTEGEIYLDEEKIDKMSNKPSIMFAKMVEEGMKSFSIKDALLKSEKAKEGKDGIKYMIIPFPVATPRREGQGTMASQFGGREMTAEVYKIVKSGAKSITSSMADTLSGKGASGEGGSIPGLTKYQTRQYHEGYGMFRCVSEKSTGWVHPGVAASPVFPRVIEEVNRQISDVLSAFCREIVREYTVT